MLPARQLFQQLLEVLEGGRSAWLQGGFPRAGLSTLPGPSAVGSPAPTPRGPSSVPLAHQAVGFTWGHGCPSAAVRPVTRRPGLLPHSVRSLSSGRDGDGRPAGPQRERGKSAGPLPARAMPPPPPRRRWGGPRPRWAGPRESPRQRGRPAQRGIPPHCGGGVSSPPAPAVPGAGGRAWGGTSCRWTPRPLPSRWRSGRRSRAGGSARGGPAGAGLGRRPFPGAASWALASARDRLEGLRPG